jgi:ATP-dependent exoDNAse (exonuclease V) beta subunit
VVLFDYKTDHFTAEEKKDKEHCRKVLAKRHKRQLGYYKAAVEGLLSRPVDEVLLYSFSLGETVTLF